MPYNYASEFTGYSTETIREASLVALMHYREEFPGDGNITVNAFPDRGYIKVWGRGTIKTYTFEELGFKV